MDKLRILIVMIYTCLILLSGCKMFDMDYCEAWIECMESIAKEHCKKNDCVVISIHNSECGGGYTIILDKKTREKVNFNFFPEEYKLCKILAEKNKSHGVDINGN